MVAYIWILIPLAGIALAAFSEYLKFKKQTSRLGSSTAELESKVESLKGKVGDLLEERQALVRRLQNLEAIVTSEAWETLGSDKELAKAKAPPLEIADKDDFDQITDQAEKMARRLKQ
jgi:hypothetical protein